MRGVRFLSFHWRVRQAHDSRGLQRRATSEQKWNTAQPESVGGYETGSACARESCVAAYLPRPALKRGKTPPPVASVRPIMRKIAAFDSPGGQKPDGLFRFQARWHHGGFLFSGEVSVISFNYDLFEGFMDELVWRSDDDLLTRAC